MRPFIFSTLICLSVVFFCSCPSCAMDPDVVSVFGGDVTPPVLLSLSPISATEILVSFTAPVSVETSRVIFQDSQTAVDWREGSKREDIVFVLDREYPIGSKGILSASIVDAKGNSLQFSSPFIAYNYNCARMVFNEIRFDYTKPKVEFIEFFVTKAGNLAGIEVFNAANITVPYYYFPAAEVSAGEFVVLHLRSVEEGLIDEIKKTDISPGTDATDSGRDFWDTQTRAPLKKTNVLILRERKLGSMMDAILCAEDTAALWPTAGLQKAADEASGITSQIIITTGTTTSRTLNRQESGDSVVWFICPTRKASPGMPNYAE